MYSSMDVYTIKVNATEDCMFLVGKHEHNTFLFLCPKSPLVRVSTFFAKRFAKSNLNQGCANKECPMIHLKNVEPHHFQRFLHYINHADVPFNMKSLSYHEITALMKLSLRFAVPKLTAHCVNQASIELLMKFFAEVHDYGFIQLARHIKQQLKQRENWKIEFRYLDQLSPSLFFELLKLVDGIVTEDERFQMIKYYSEMRLPCCLDGLHAYPQYKVLFKGVRIKCLDFVRKVLRLLNIKGLENTSEYELFNRRITIVLDDIPEEN